MKITIGAILAVLCVTNAFGQASYNSEKNWVDLRTSILGGNHGWMTIYSATRIEVSGAAIDRASQKMIGMCRINPSLGLLFLDKELNLTAKVPKISDFLVWNDASDDGKVTSAAGWVRGFVLTGDDARDLIDMLHDYKYVGFSIRSDDACQETKYYTHGTLTLNFDTKGVERAMARIK